MKRTITIVYEAEVVDHEGEAAILEGFYSLKEADERSITFHPAEGMDDSSKDPL